MIDFIGALALIVTVAIYIFSRKLHQWLPMPFTLPIIVCSFVIVLALVSFNIPYERYMKGGEWIDQMLGIAVVALAYPVYEQRAILKRMLLPIVSGTVAGGFVGIASGVLLAKSIGVDESVIYSLASKSVTTPVSILVADSLGGIMPLAAVFVIIAGVTGAVIHRYLFRWIHMDDAISRGVALGSASHAIGTASALENSRMEGSVSTIAMVMSAVIVTLMAPAIVGWLM